MSDQLGGRWPTNQRELANAEINRSNAVPTVWLLKLESIEASTRSFSAEELKEYSRRNRETRLAAST